MSPTKRASPFFARSGSSPPPARPSKSVSLFIFTLPKNTIYFSHQLLSFKKRNNNLLIMQYILKPQCSVASVFEPFLSRLVATNVELPRRERDVVKILRVVNPNAAQLVFFVGDLPIVAANACSY